MRKQQFQTTRQFSLLMLALALVIFLQMTLSRSPLTRATGGGPMISWHHNLTSPGQYHGYPWGTPNEDIAAGGEGFTAGQQLQVVLAEGNSNSDPTICNHSLQSVYQATVNRDGTFGVFFTWPLNLNKVNQAYSLCALTKDGTVVSSRNEPGPFIVAAANAPEINVQPTTVAAGGTLIVTGQNWVLPHEILLNLTDPKAEIGVRGIKAMVIKQDQINNGTFEVAFTIPKYLPPGAYNIGAGIDLFAVGVISNSINVTVI